MAVHGDFVYLQHLLDRGVVRGRVLEVGSLNHQGGPEGNTRESCIRAGLEWRGTDLEIGPGVDFTLDVLDEQAVRGVSDRWDTVLVYNLLEHLYDPIRALQNVIRLATPAGVVVVVGPTVWEVHDYPRDFWRPMPDFFFEFAARHDLELLPETLMWIVNDRLVPIDELRDESQKLLPSKRHAARIYGSRPAVWSRLVHRAFLTLGRGRLIYPQSGLGAALRVPAATGR